MPVATHNPEVLYDPMDPRNVAAREHDLDDGIDYEEIFATTEADFWAGRGMWFADVEAFHTWFADFSVTLLQQADERVQRPEVNWQPRVAGDIARLATFVRRQPWGNPSARLRDLDKAIEIILDGPDQS